ncbi:MAG: hypothetical protein ABI623_08460, partial [bacterium]
MKLSSETKKSFTGIATMTVVIAAVGLLYGIVFGHSHPNALLNGLIIGAIIGLVSSVVEIYLFSRNRQRL